MQFCGDGVVEAGEQCDDGNDNPGDGCDQCMLSTWTATAVIGGNASATAVDLDDPLGVAVDRDGNVYIADTQSERIRRVDAATGIVTTVAGTGDAGYSGDGGAATSAQLDNPRSVAVDGRGTVYIADTMNHCIRQVDASTGVITTVAGTGAQGYSGVGGAATSEQLHLPAGVAIDGLGNLFIADTGNHRIRRVDATTGVITTIAGNGTSGFSGDGGAATSAQLRGPEGLAVDALGTVFIADTQNQRIRRVDAVTGVITTVAGTGIAGHSGDSGAATSAQLDLPLGVGIDGLGTIYIGDTVSARVRKIDATTGIITTVAGNGTLGFGGDGGVATSAELHSNNGVAVDGLGNLFIADAGNSRIRRVDASTSIITTFAGTGAQGYSGDGGLATSVHLASPNDVAVDALGNLYIADTANARIQRVDAMTGIITTVAGDGTVAYGGDGGAATAAQLHSPDGVAIDGLGNLYIADAGNARIRRVDAMTGVITTVVGTGTAGYGGDGGMAISAQIANPLGVALDAVGNLYIADFGNSRVRRVDVTGVITTVAGTGAFAYGGDGGAAISAQINEPSGVAVDGLGNLYIADTNNDRIRRVDVTAIITTVAGSGASGSGGDGGLATSATLFRPFGVTVDEHGNLYIADTDNSRLRRVDATSNIITTVAGNGTIGAGGDGGVAASAQLDDPSGVAVDGLGTIYIADTGNSRIRRVDATTSVITTIAGSIDPEGMGPVGQGHLADPRAIIVTSALTVIAGGSSGTVQERCAAARSRSWPGSVRPQPIAAGQLARFRDATFGTVSGVAYDATAGIIYLTESSANRIQAVTIVDPNDVDTWTIAPIANTAGTPGFADGAAATAMFREPTGLFLDTHQLYIADTGNHVIRMIDLASNLVTTVIGTPATLGFFGDGGAATSALLYRPQALTKCANGLFFIADTGNNRIRRVDAAGTITTVLGDGGAASSGDGGPATTFPIDAPLGVACDALGNLYATSTTTVREIPANDSGVVDGTGPVRTIYGAAPRRTFPSSVTSCLTGIDVVDTMTVLVTDSCTGLLVQLVR